MDEARTRQIDAACLPLGYSKAKTNEDRLRAIAAEFAPLMGRDRVCIRHHGSHVFVTPDIADTLLFPKDHPRAGEERYLYEERGDGVRLGILKPDDDGPPISDEERKRSTDEAVGRLRARLTVRPGAAETAG
jgi:hypothetical protein